MNTARLEAFTDGVMAVALTIMVLELREPETAQWQALLADWPIFLSYILSFFYVAIYWNNHHHLMHMAEKINGRILWANLFLVFWITLIPFTTAWFSRHPFTAAPVMLYGLILLMAAVAFALLQREIACAHGGQQSALQKAIGKDFKLKLSLALYLSAIIIAVWLPWLSCFCYALVAALWFVPDRRFANSIN